MRACGCAICRPAPAMESALGGLPAGYFIRQMADFKNGDRKGGGTMVAMAKVITDAEIEDGADYFASLKPGPGPGGGDRHGAEDFIGPGNMRLAHPDGGTEPIGNRIINVPQDAARAASRDPCSGSSTTCRLGASSAARRWSRPAATARPSRAASAMARPSRALARFLRWRGAPASIWCASSTICRPVTVPVTVSN